VSFHVPEELRVLRCKQAPHLETDHRAGNNGLFYIPPNMRRPVRLVCIASDGTDWEMAGLEPPTWEHVSASTAARCPTWEEMCYVKELFWDEEDTVIQLHPPRSEWVNDHPYCLHLWRPIGVEIPRPQRITVGDGSLERAPRRA
jgi:hypothetical protein